MSGRFDEIMVVDQFMQSTIQQRSLNARRQIDVQALR
jgi:hypothetical protein